MLESSFWTKKYIDLYIYMKQDSLSIFSLVQKFIRQSWASRLVYIFIQRVIFTKYTPHPHPVLALLQFDLICAFFVYSLLYTLTPSPLYPIHLHSLSSLSNTPPLPLLFIQYTSTPSPLYPIHLHSLSSLSNTPPLPLLFIQYTSTPSPLYPIHLHSLSSLSNIPPTSTSYPLYPIHSNSLSSLSDIPPTPYPLYTIHPPFLSCLSDIPP